MARCVITRALPGDAPERLADAGHEVTIWPGSLPPSPGELRALCADADGLHYICGRRNAMYKARGDNVYHAQVENAHKQSRGGAE